VLGIRAEISIDRDRRWSTYTRSSSRAGRWFVPCIAGTSPGGRQSVVASERRNERGRQGGFARCARVQWRGRLVSLALSLIPQQQQARRSRPRCCCCLLACLPACLPASTMDAARYRFRVTCVPFGSSAKPTPRKLRFVPALRGLLLDEVRRRRRRSRLGATHDLLARRRAPARSLAHASAGSGTSFCWSTLSLSCRVATMRRAPALRPRPC